MRDGGGELTLDDLAAYRVVWRRPVRVAVPRLRVVLSNPPPSSGGVLIAYGLALLERLDGGAAGSAEAIAALVEVMREQTRARGGSFSRDLHRGGLAARLALTRPSCAPRGAGSTRASPARREPAPTGGTTHVSVVDGEGNAASLSTSTGSGSGVIVPGTGIYLNNMLGEYDLVGGKPVAPGRRLTSMMAPSIVLARDGSAAARRRQRRLGPAARRDHADRRQRRSSTACRSRRRSTAPRVHVDEPHVHCEGGHDPAELDRLEALGYDVVALADAEPLLRRRRRRSRSSRTARSRPPATRAAAAPGVVVGA